MKTSASNWPIAEVVRRCLNRPADESAWQEFVRRLHPTIVESVSKAYRFKMSGNGAGTAQSYEKIIDHLVQAVYIRLVESHSQALARFDADHLDSIYQYVALICYRSVFNYARAH